MSEYVSIKLKTSCLNDISCYHFFITKKQIKQHFEHGFNWFVNWCNNLLKLNLKQHFILLILGDIWSKKTNKNKTSSFTSKPQKMKMKSSLTFDGEFLFARKMPLNRWSVIFGHSVRYVEQIMNWCKITSGLIKPTVPISYHCFVWRWHPVIRRKGIIWMRSTGLPLSLSITRYSATPFESSCSEFRASL